MGKWRNPPLTVAEKNRKHYLKITQAGYCPNHSDRPVVPNRVVCEECILAAKRRASAAKAAGKCPRHPSVDMAKGKKSCEACLVNGRIQLLPKSIRQAAREAWTNFQGVCQICGTTSPVNGRWCFDHKDNLFRGILCLHCNWALGHIKDDIKILENMMNYLVSFR